MGDTRLREAVGVFHDERSLHSAVDALLISGFDRSHLSLLAGQRATRAKLGDRLKKVMDLEDNPATPKRAYVGIDSRTEGEAAIVGGLFYVGAVAAAGVIVASGGTIAAALIAGAMAGGGGGLIGGALVLFLERRHASQLQAQIDRGGLLLWVRVPAPEDEWRAVDILRAHGADSAHVHSLPMEHRENANGVSYGVSFMRRVGMALWCPGSAGRQASATAGRAIEKWRHLRRDRSTLCHGRGSLATGVTPRVARGSSNPQFGRSEKWPTKATSETPSNGDGTTSRPGL